MRVNLSLANLSLLSFFAVLVQGQYGSSQTVSAQSATETDSESACTSGNVHEVTVGANGNKFDPNIVYAQPGDIVSFIFYPSNHSVIRTAYTGQKFNSESSGNPCVPIEELDPEAQGFFSGNKILESDPSPGNIVTWNLTIVDSDTIWYYCDALGSCHPNGMVGVINPNSTGTFQQQQAAAVSAPFQLSPSGQVTPSESGPIPASSSKGSSGGSSGRLSGGAIAGIAVGAVFGLALLAGLCFFMGKSSKYKGMLKGKGSGEQPAQPDMTPKMAYPSPYHDPTGFRNTFISDTTTIGEHMGVPYQRGGVHSSYMGEPQGYPNMSPNIMMPHDKSAPGYGRVSPEYYQVNAATTGMMSNGMMGRSILPPGPGPQPCELATLKEGEQDQIREVADVNRAGQ